MTLLSIVQNVSDIVGVPRPSAVVTSTDQTVRTMLALSNQGGKQLAKERGKSGGWIILQGVHTFSTVDGTEEYSLPSDYDRPINDTFWDRSSYWQMVGPTSPQRWEWIKSGLVEPVSPYLNWRMRRGTAGNVNKFYVDPTPTAAYDLAFEYISNAWVLSGSSTYSSWQADDDTSLLPEYLHELDLIWRFKAAKGFDYAADLATFEINRDRELGGDGGAPTLNMSPRRWWLPQGNTQEGNYPGPGNP